MSHAEIPTLSEVDLPEEGSWVAFRAGSRVYVLRADPDATWTLLCQRGQTLGTVRRAGQRYRISTEGAQRPALTDWRDAVQQLCDAPPPT